MSCAEPVVKLIARVALRANRQLSGSHSVSPTLLPMGPRDQTQGAIR